MHNTVDGQMCWTVNTLGTEQLAENIFKYIFLKKKDIYLDWFKFAIRAD